MKTIMRKKMLYKSKVEYMRGKGVYAMNHVLGCSHGCKYPCYAYLAAKRFGQVQSYKDWCEPKLVENTLELIERELKIKRKEPIKRVHMCFTTDPFQTMREATETCWNDMRLIHETTMDAIDMINRAKIPVTILTKGVLPKPDWEEGALYLQDTYATAYHEVFNPHRANYYGISLVSLDEGFREQMEPGAAPFSERIASLKVLHDEGCKTWVSMEPWMEPICCNDASDAKIRELYRVLDAVSFVDHIVFGKHNYSGKFDSPLSKAYYNDCAKIVREFCATHKIKCVVKKGTEQ